MVDSGVGERTGTRGGDDVGRGREVVKGATVEAAVVDGGYGAAVEEAKLEQEDDEGGAEEAGIVGVDADELKMSTALE